MHDMTLKLPRYFYLLMEKPLGRYFEVWSPYYQVAQRNQKHLSLYHQGDRSGLRKPKKEASTLITVATSVHLPKSVSTDLTIKSDLVLTNLIGKDGVRDIFIVIPPLEVGPTKAKEAPFPHKVRLTPLESNPVFQCLGDKMAAPQCFSVRAHKQAQSPVQRRVL